ncbi:MAG: InlB B-repeat-containing protein, partial [Lachnospiraceae bacterium]|nr:InlB B-repeat-containing protein [Lachnospiraceae bacterium]
MTSGEGNTEASASPLDLRLAGESTITLQDNTENILDASATTDCGPGLWVPEDQKLTITGTGELTAKGGKYSAGIGGYGNGTIRIEDGTITAVGGQYAAGIGGSYDGTDNSNGGNIQISGGYVKATAGSGADTIGSGSGQDPASVTIIGGCFGEGDSVEGTVYGLSVADGYCVTENTEADTKGVYPYAVVTEPETETETETETEVAESETETELSTEGEIETETETEALCDHGNDAETCKVCKVEALIDALPTLAELIAMDTDEQNEVYYQASDICDIYYDELTEDEQDQVSNIDNLWDVLDYFSGGISLTASSSVTYVDENGSSHTCSSYSSVTSSSSAVTWGTSGSTTWYVASGTLECSAGVKVYGTVYLILASGCTLTVLNELNVDSSSTLIIYGGTATSGTLVANGTNQYKAGIGKGGTVIINSGTVTATGGDYSGGIGGDGTIEINGGTITATAGEYGAGIGGNNWGTGGTITINGGTVTATGGYWAAGIGNGSGNGVKVDGCIITITGGYIKATGGQYAPAAIGAGAGNDNQAEIIITGGYFAEGDTSANTVYGVSTPGCSVVSSGNSTYPYYVNALTYTVTLNTNGGTINSGNVTSYTYGKGATLPRDITNGGYTFVGWYEDSSFSGSAVTEIGTADYGNKTYYAKWAMAFVVSSDATCSYTYTNHLLTITGGGSCTISMNTAAGITSTTTDRIKVTSSDDVTITINS